jgi:hypothetical protein
VKTRIFRQRRRVDADAEFGFDQRVRLAVIGITAAERTDIECGVRPGRLREVFDDAGNLVVALDQQHVAGPERSGQRGRVARRERLIAGDRALQVAGEQPPNMINRTSHNGVPSTREVSPRPALTVI